MQIYEESVNTPGVNINSILAAIRCEYLNWPYVRSLNSRIQNQLHGQLTMKLYDDLFYSNK